MSIKLNIGVGCTISDDKYDSRSASISVEVELDGPAETASAKIREDSRQLCELLRQVLIDELEAN